MKIAILGWGSLLWDTRSEKGINFERTLVQKPPNSTWRKTTQIRRPDGGLKLNLEFSRISQTRNGVLTLVIDADNCPYEYQSHIFFAESQRSRVADSVRDLATREGTGTHNIASWKRQDDELGAGPFPMRQIEAWTRDTKFDAVVWTALESNYNALNEGTKFFPFTPTTALDYLKSLQEDVQRDSVEYICRAPSALATRLRRQLEQDEWYVSLAKELNLPLTPAY